MDLESLIINRFPQIYNWPNADLSTIELIINNHPVCRTCLCARSLSPGGRRGRLLRAGGLAARRRSRRLLRATGLREKSIFYSIPQSKVLNILQ